MLPLSFLYRLQSLGETTGPTSSLIRAGEQLANRYRAGQERKDRAGFASSAEAVAYAATRLPGAFAALKTVLSHTPLGQISSVLDLGAGPGTAALAAALHWPTCARFHLIEEDAFMSALSQRLLKDLPEIAHQRFSFQRGNLLTLSDETSYDLVFLSYVLSELSAEDQRTAVQKAWRLAQKGLIIVTPGTPAAYKRLMALRDLLIEAGAFIAAPCPHHGPCPLPDPDWCHFSTRLPRSSFHRAIKNASLPFEDEKYSYLGALRHPSPRPSARAIRKPLRRSGHVTLDLCTPDGLKRQTFSKRDKALYKAAAKLLWGDDWQDDGGGDREDDWE